MTETALHQFGVTLYEEPSGGESWVVTDWIADRDYFRRQIRLDLGFHESETAARKAARAASRRDADSDPETTA